jgi:hypothetical protein
MSLRAIIVVPLATFVAIMLSGDLPLARQPAFNLRIESLSRDTLNVHVTTLPLASEKRRVRPQDTLVVPPVILPVSDSIGRIHVVVQGFRSVRVTLTTALGTSPDSIVSEGRDITLARKASGQFERVWTAQHLLP